MLSAWRFVTVFGTVSLPADFVYEGARSITGPLLASLGATGLVVGLVTGIGEAAALGLRLVSGPLTDRTQRFWAWTIAGYTLTIVTVPVLGIAATLWVASALVIAERVGKAVRSPAKDTLLSHAAAVTGRGKGFAVHEALDQIGAVIGPLTVAAVLALTDDDYGPALGVLAIPGVAALALLIWLVMRVPDPARYEPHAAAAAPPTAPVANTSRPRSAPLPAAFWAYCAFTATTMIGFATFGVLSFHMVTRGILSAAAVGIQESTLRAVVADLVAPPRRATAYGVFAAGLGAATAAGGALTGWLYDTSVTALVITVAVIQAAAVVLAIGVLVRRRRTPSGP